MGPRAASCRAALQPHHQEVCLAQRVARRLQRLAVPAAHVRHGARHAQRQFGQPARSRRATHAV